LIKQFYKEYVFPVSPTPNYRPVVDVIIAARRHTKSMTWMARGNRLRKVKEFAAFGSGEAYARALFSGLDLAMSNEVAMCVAAYIIFLIKKRNMSVALDTQVICIDRENWYVPRGLNTKECRQLEEVFRQCAGIEARVLHRIMGSTFGFCDKERVYEDIEFLRDEFLRLVQPSSATKSNTDQA